MNKPTALNVRVTGELSDFVASNIGEHGLYENASEYVRDLIRRDFVRVEQERFEALRRELQVAFAQPDSTAEPLDADVLIARLKSRYA